jgi:hypothetical protein
MTTYAVIVTSTNICDNVVVWDDTLGLWTPPTDHYIVNIDGLEVGIGYYYNPATQVWTAPPSVTASFSPAPIFLSQSTVLTWVSENATSVTVNGVAADLNGSQTFTPDKVGKFSVTVVATGLAGSASTTATVTVVATQSELVI